MSISSWFPWKLGRQHKGRSRPPHSPKVPRRTRLVLEQLEGRCVPTVYPVATVPELIAAIDTANSTPVADTIELAAGTTFTLTEVNNTTDGSSGLPVIAAAGGSLTILGNGDTIERSSASGTPSFRLFNVAAGASLTLSNVTVQGGKVVGSGGAIYSSGSLTLDAGTIVRDNQAIGLPAWGYPFRVGQPAYGGGVYVAAGTATLTDVTLSSNSAWGGPGRYFVWVSYPHYSIFVYTVAGSAYGGGVYVAGGTATLTHVTLSANSAVGGSGAIGGHGKGGGLYVAGGAVALNSATLSANSAKGGVGGYSYGPPKPPLVLHGGMGAGGGMYVAAGTVGVDTTTFSSNSAVGGPRVGPYKSGNPGSGRGGGLLAVSGSTTVTLRNSTVSGNSAKHGDGKSGSGGGLYFSLATAYLDTFTVSHTTENQPNNIVGSYTLIT